MKQKSLPDKKCNTGELSSSDGLRDFFELLISSEEVKRGVLRIESDSLAGSIGVFASRYITGARLDNSTATGFEALRQLLSLRQGTYQFDDASSDQMVLLQSSVAIDVVTLIDWAQPDSCDPPPLERALDALIEMYAQTMVPLAAPQEASEPTDASLDPEHQASPPAGYVDPYNTFADESAYQLSVLTPPGEQVLTPINELAPENEPANMLVPYNPEDLDAIPTPGNFENNADPFLSYDIHNDVDNLWTKSRVQPISERDRQAVDQIYTERQRLASPRDFLRVPKQTGQAAKSEPPIFRHKEVDPGLQRKVVIGFVLCFCLAFGTTLASTILAQGRSNDMLQRGVNHLKEGNKLAALIDFDSSVQANPNNTEAIIMLATAQAELGDYGSALAVFTKARKLSPKDIRPILGVANCLIKRNDYDDAIGVLNDGLRLQPDNAQAHSLRAIAYAYTSQYSEAIDDANRAIAKAGNSVSPDTYQARAYAEWKHGETKAALRDFTKTIELSGGDSKCFLGRGSCSLALGDLNGAIADLTQAIKQDASLTSAFIARADALAKKGAPDQAIADLDKALELQPQSREALQARGDVYMRMRQFGKAIADFEEILSLEPDNAEVSKRRDLAYQLVKQLKPIIAGDRPQADPIPVLLKPSLKAASVTQSEPKKTDPEVQALTKKLHDSPNDTNSRRYLAYALMRTGNIVAAAEQFHMLDEAGSLASQDKFAFGEMLARGGNLVGAANVYKRMLVINPRDEAARLALAKIYTLQGRDDEADALTSLGALQTMRRPYR